MNLLSETVTWIYRSFAIWSVVGTCGGGFILVAERLSRRAEPRDADVKRAAEGYRQCYGERASAVLGDHMIGARFAPDSRHSRFLRRVADELEWRSTGLKGVRST